MQYGFIVAFSITIIYLIVFFYIVLMSTSLTYVTYGEFVMMGRDGAQLG